MGRAFASSLFSLLLLTTLVWGGCISCEEFFMLPGAKSCCSPKGHCKTKPPTPQKSNRDCKQIAYDRHKSVDVHIEQPIIAVLTIDFPTQPVEPLERWHCAVPIEPSPPDLQILNSTFLI